MLAYPAPRWLKLCRKALVPVMMMIAVLLCGTQASAMTISYTYDTTTRVAKVVYGSGLSRSMVLDEEGNVLHAATQAQSVLLHGMMALLLPGQGSVSQAQGLQTSVLQ
ncbi:hypothetical protein [Fundidesulfovibrio soli]|uniref:hypothetical protein n=1 Tax=Fundidesulfovibrio soli TaxID=2922716 RepID=UPI001FAF1875|nr:hypothetical protein [Fundidesulfovibrio soli]